MVYIFEDGRVLVAEERPEGACLAVAEYPVAPKVEGKIGYISGCDLEKKEVLFTYADEPKPELIKPQEPLSQIEQAILETALNTEYLVCLKDLGI